MGLLHKATTQKEKDSINWARAYALVELKLFKEAQEIWREIFQRTGSHMALHQVGYVLRSANKIEEALKVYFEEHALIPSRDNLAMAANLYELAYCNFLMANSDEAFQYLNKYEQITFTEIDPIERGCFFRLKGDLAKGTDVASARSAYEKSLEFFKEAKDKIAVAEVEDRLSQLST